MVEKKHKTFDEWKNIIGNLTPQDFEHLCYQLSEMCSLQRIRKNFDKVVNPEFRLCPFA
jgi:hypothetical protein